MRRLIWLLPLALAGIILLWCCTPMGLGLGGDSYYYVSGARDLLAGEGFTRPAADGTFRPITHFPPLYSTVLASLSALGIDTLSAARGLNSLLFGANILLLGAVILWATGSLGLAILGSLAFLASPAMLSVHSWVLSDPLYLVLAILNLWALTRFLETGRWQSGVAAGVLAGAAYLVRYVGLALLGTSALLLLLLPGRPWRRRLRDTAICVGIGSLAPAGWAIRNLIAAGSTTNRALGIHVIPAEKLFEAAQTLSLWLLPGRVPSGIRLGTAGVVGLGVLAAGVAVFIRARWGKDSQTQEGHAVTAVVVLLAFSVASVLLLGLSLTFLDASTPLDDRILSPLFVAGLLIGLLSVHVLRLNARPGRAVMLGLGLLLGGWLVLTAIRGASTATRLHSDGQGYAGRQWQASEIVQWVRGLSPQVPIYTNELNALYLLTGRQAFQAPIRWDPVRAAPREDYEQQLAAMRERIADQGAALVLFDTLAEQQGALPSEAELASGLRVIVRASDGVVYAAWETGSW